MTVKLKLMFLLGILFVSTIGNSFFTFQLEAHGEEKLAWVNHTHNVLNHSQLLLSALKDAETGQRGFLLTGVSAYLQPYYAGEISSAKHLSALKFLTSDNPEQQQRLKLIEDQMSFKFSELIQTIEMAQSDGNSQRAVELVKNNEGKEYMDELRKILSEFNNVETILLEERKGNFKASLARISTLIIVELVFFVSLAVFTVFFLQKNLFQPLSLLLSSTRKSADGHEIEVGDLLHKDEMGYLLASFFEMNRRIVKNTKKLNFKVNHDKLTGLKNRSTMSAEIERAIKHSIKFKTKSALLFIDLDDFKLLNDSLGHDAGDQLLIEVATRITKNVRTDDSIFRIGGDEFIVLIKDLKDLNEIKQVIAKVLCIAEYPVMIQEEEIKIKFSVGVVVTPDDSDDPDVLIKYADVAMYAAKRDEESHCKFFDKNLLRRGSDV